MNFSLLWKCEGNLVCVLDSVYLTIWFYFNIYWISVLLLPKFQGNELLQNIEEMMFIEFWPGFKLKSIKTSPVTAALPLLSLCKLLGEGNLQPLDLSFWRRRNLDWNLKESSVLTDSYLMRSVGFHAWDGKVGWSESPDPTSHNQICPDFSSVSENSWNWNLNNTASAKLGKVWGSFELMRQPTDVSCKACLF